MRKVLLLLTVALTAMTANAQLTVTPGDSSMCAGDTLTYMSSGMSILGWVDTLNQDTAFASSYDFTTSVVGTHTLYAVGINLVPQDTDTVSVQITVNANPMVSIMSSAGGSAICGGSSVELIAMPAEAAIYSWSPAATLDNDTTDTVIATPDTATTYTVMIVDSNGCMGMDSVSIDVNVSPSVTIVSSASVDNNFVCEGNSATLTASTDSSVVSFEWSPVATLSDSVGMSVVATPTNNTTYSVMVTDSNGCTDSDNQQVRVNDDPPAVVFEPTEGSICQGESIFINVLSTGETYSWTPITGVDNPTEQDVNLSPSSTTTYTCTTSEDGCEASNTITITVIPSPSITLAQTAGNSSILLDETAEFTATCPTCINYLWELPNSSFFSTNNVQNISPNTPGIASITVTGFAEECSNEATASIEVIDGYSGTPFGISENGEDQNVRIVNQADRVVFEANATIQTVQLYNLLGEEIATLNAVASQTASLTTASLASGVYIANIQFTDGNTLTEKVYLNK